MDPLAEAIQNHANAVMLAHILFSKTDENNPASLSKTVVTVILRRDLNFNGVVIAVE